MLFRKKKIINLRHLAWDSLVFTYSPPVTLGSQTTEAISGWPQPLLCICLVYILPALGRSGWFNELASLLETICFSVVSWHAKEASVHRNHLSSWGTQTPSGPPQSLILQVSSDSSHPSLEVTKSFPLIAGTKWNQLSYIKDIQDWYKKKTFTFIAVFVTRGIYAQVTKLQRKRAPLTGQCPSTTRVPLLREFKFLLCKNLTKLSKSTLKRLE